MDAALLRLPGVETEMSGADLARLPDDAAEPLSLDWERGSKPQWSLGDSNP
jgi:hypothetical protein